MFQVTGTRMGRRTGPAFKEEFIMGLRINQNIAAANAYRNLSVTDNQMSKSLEKLSSGFRINRAADDAAGLSISEGLRAQIGGLKVAVRNAQDGISVVQTAEGALTETHSILQRMRDLAVQASSSGSQDSDARAAANTEFAQLGKELDRIASTTAFGGQKLLDMSYLGTFQVGANNSGSDQIAVDLDVAANVFGAVAASVTGFGAIGLGVSTNTVGLATGASAAAAITAIDTAIKGVSTARATLGAYQNRFEHTINNLNVTVENLTASESRIRDTDMAQEMVAFTRSQILTQAGTSMLAQANQAPQSVLSLLR
jgi:flagellin